MNGPLNERTNCVEPQQQPVQWAFITKGERLLATTPGAVATGSCGLLEKRGKLLRNPAAQKSKIQVSLYVLTRCPHQHVQGPTVSQLTPHWAPLFIAPGCDPHLINKPTQVQFGEPDHGLQIIRVLSGLGIGHTQPTLMGCFPLGVAMD